jgi:hypothetical protein
MNIEINIFTALEKELKNLGPGKQTAKTWFGLEK